MLLAQADGLADKVKDNWILAAMSLGVLVAAVVLYRIATSRPRKHLDPERGLREDLGGYPPPPAAAGSERLTVDGLPVRVRLVVVAPVGRLQEATSPAQVPGLLDDVLRGLGRYVTTDKPRVKVWPPQLSMAGFAPTFHRLVQSPDRPGRPSRWVKVAGPARAGQRNILLGLALLADEPCKLGEVPVEPTEWHRLLAVARG
jgi:hypothetical protein